VGEGRTHCSYPSHGIASAQQLYFCCRAVEQEAPAKLSIIPILEAVFEVRFSPVTEGAGDVLVGLLYSGFPAYSKVIALPAAAIPRDARDRDPNLRYLPSHQLAGEKKRIQIGDRVVSLSVGAPYEGWKAFRSEILTLIAAVKATNLVGSVERYSLKYVNLIEAEAGKQLSLINGKFEVAGAPASEQGFRFRTELVSDGFTSIIEIFPSAVVQITAPAHSKSGILVQVDVIRMSSPEDIWQDAEPRLDELHQRVKTLFFSILTKDTIDSLGPIW
jgi:uncharacterized protein (TIGR04255 family)